MKNIYKISLAFLALILIMGSCQKKEFVQINPNAKIEAQLSSQNLILSENTADQNVLEVSWNEPDFGFDAAPTYTVLLDVEGGDFSQAVEFPVGIEMQKTFTGNELNNKLLALGLQAGTAQNVIFKVRAKLGTSETFYSNILTLTVTPYATILDLSTTWGIVGSATPGGWGDPNIPDLPFYQTDNPNIIIAYVTLRDGEIKFRENNDWTNNLGDNGLDNSLDPNGANIPVNAGTYKVTIDWSSNTYTIEAYSWGIVGSATPNGWNGPDIKLTYNPYNDDWKAAVTLNAGEIKFRLNNDWAINYGDTGADGTLELGGDNIVVNAGHYIVTFNPKKMTYSIDTADLWGLVGDATPNGWNGPDIKFLPDFGLNPGKFYLNGVTLNNGEIKIRQNDDWGVNYGDNGNDGTLDLNGTNIPVNAGTYNIVLDFSVNPPTIQMYAWQ